MIQVFRWYYCDLQDVDIFPRDEEAIVADFASTPKTRIDHPVLVI